jgi:hypothetical protein
MSCAKNTDSSGPCSSSSRETASGVRSCGETDLFRKAMDTLARRILTDIDDGRYDPLERMTAEGRG